MECHTAPIPTHAEAAFAVGAATIALAGQPNMGKSTLFNLLTGLNQHVGNWPGKTVEHREGVFNYNDRRYRLVDLPGTYSLTANSPEEVVAREFILREKPDVVVAVVSAANLERSLYLVSELICLPAPLVVALNMMDVAEQEGIHVSPEILEAALGVPVMPVTATRAAGVRELLAEVERCLQGQRRLVPHLPEIRCDHRETMDELVRLMGGFVPAPYPTDWAAMKLLEGDGEMTALLEKSVPADRWNAANALLEKHDDAMLAIASGRYDWIAHMMRAAVSQPRLGQISLTDRIDRWATHPFWGLVILAGILGLVFWLTFTVGAPIQNWLDTAIVVPLGGLAGGLLAGAPTWLRSLVVDAMIGGVGSVLTFLPIMVVFFASFGFLEDVGYMARAAFVMDNFMHLMGLHGKSFLPIFLGFGCNVPAVMGTRVIDSPPARLLTILIAPLVPCTARMAVLAFIAPAFFGASSMWVSWGLILLALVLLVLSGIVFNRLLFKGERSAFIMELPLYHAPNARTIGLLVWQRSQAFVKKAGTIILAMSVAIWILATLPGGSLQTSFLARLGQLLAPVGAWMGMDWRLTVALLTSFLAKENSIATLGVLFGSSQGAGLAHTLAATYSPAAGLAFLTVSILFIPCAATVAVIRQETGSWRWTLLNIAFMLVLSVGAGSAVYALAKAVGI
ncbi:MAG TPA: ferrous iron transport protein B [Anaerolineaceae bacterium]|nr:ferrous iron transport protein B [Anaerolineaceae bacterium]